MPSTTAEARKRLIARFLAEHSAGGELLHVPWQDATKDLPVVKIPLDAVLLNPKSHRIRAQIESHADRQIIETEPYSERAQEIVAGILRTDSGYEVLKTNLGEFGQINAGIVTREGLLVNANRRVVALRELRRDYVRVAVLPESALESEIDQLEFHLQVSKEFREEYTFTNELLVVDELLTKYRRTPEQAAIELNWAASKSERELREGRKLIERATRLLSLIREIQAMSGMRLRLTDFDEFSVALEETDRQYETLKSEDPTVARKVRDTRMLGMIAGVQYRQLRHIDENFLEKYLLPALNESEVLSGHIQVLATSDARQNREPSGLDLLDTEDPVGDNPDPAQLLAAFAESANQQTIELPSPTGPQTVDRSIIQDELLASFSTAAEDARMDAKQLDKLNTPLDLLQEANRTLKRAGDAYTKVSSDTNFDLSKFKTLLKQATRSLDAIKNEVESRKS